MILGYGIIAVPTGIVTVEFAKHGKDLKKADEGSWVHINTQSCPNCSVEGHRDDAKFCYECGEPLK
jgi:voltage-gated potassium channel